MPTDSDRSPPGRGLVLFGPRVAPARRRRRLVFVGVWLTAGAALLWPIYPLFSAPEPQILGLPMSLAWPILWIGVVFAATAWLFVQDDRRR